MARYRTPEDLDWSLLLGQDLHIEGVGPSIIGIRDDKSIVVLAHLMRPGHSPKKPEIVTAHALPPSSLSLDVNHDKE
jgi:hypothetical protein